MLSLELRFPRLAPDPPAISPGTHIWAHRVETLAQLAARTRGGFEGIELDIHYFRGRGFLVKHDPPGPEDRLRLEPFFEQGGRRFFYWLDFKNLSDRNADEATAAFRELFQQFPIRDRILVESTNAAALSRLKRSLPGLRVLYWIVGYPSGPGIRPLLARVRIRWRVATFGFGNVSTADRAKVAPFLRDFSHLGMYLFTINEPKRMTALAEAGVSVILTDLEAVPAALQR